MLMMLLKMLEMEINEIVVYFIFCKVQLYLYFKVFEILNYRNTYSNPRLHNFTSFQPHYRFIIFLKICFNWIHCKIWCSKANWQSIYISLQYLSNFICYSLFYNKILITKTLLDYIYSYYCIRKHTVYSAFTYDKQ